MNCLAIVGLAGAVVIVLTLLVIGALCVCDPAKWIGDDDEGDD